VRYTRAERVGDVMSKTTGRMNQPVRITDQVKDILFHPAYGHKLTEAVRDGLDTVTIDGKRYRIRRTGSRPLNSKK
jgi:hypothetical protein